LTIERCIVRNSAGRGFGLGLTIRPSVAVSVVVTDSLFLNNGTSTTGAGIQILPPSGGSAVVSLDRVTVSGNTFGIAVDSTSSGSGNTSQMTINDSLVSGNTQDGIVATTGTGGGLGTLLIRNTRSVNNPGFGVRTIGTGVTASLDTTTVTGNGTGIAAVSGATIFT